MMAAPGAAQMSEEGRAEAAGDALAKRAKSLTKQANLPQKMKKMARFWLDFEDIPLIIPAAPADLPTDCQVMALTSRFLRRKACLRSVLPSLSSVASSEDARATLRVRIANSKTIDELLALAEQAGMGEEAPDEDEDEDMTCWDASNTCR
eukprot:TRINITY_DN8290_c0_g1_i2.p1 TRINITY_DN8290_c0_g1~~TRINITY_DN8290_c0_g1_i2.p1  ORF type:complete len:150 (+),score=47.61 TRINITY_DN8290_c0_g1_i2:45-494(+)